MTSLTDIDIALVQWLNGFAGHGKADNAIRFVTDWHFFRSSWMGFVVAWAWFRFRDDDSRLKLEAGMIGLLVATGVSKALQLKMNIHPRPFTLADELGLRLPGDLDTNWGAGNCYPSDTCTLYFALAAIIFSVSRVWGGAAFVWVTAVIGVPRVFLLYHWPSDIIAGCCLGIACVALFQVNRQALTPLSWGLALERLKPHVFYPVMFLFLYQLIDCFDAVEVTLHQIGALRHHLVADPGALKTVLIR